MGAVIQPPSSLKTFNVTDYGAKGDTYLLVDCSTTNGSGVVSSASRTFTSADVGKVVTGYNPTNVLVPLCHTTVGSVSGNTFTLAGGVHITQTIVNTACFYVGTDDTAAIQAAVNAANPIDSGGVGTTWTNQQGGLVVLPAGIYMITAEIEWRTSVSMQGQGFRNSVLKWASSQAMGQTGYAAAITGFLANGSSRIYQDCGFYDFQIDMNSAFMNGYSYPAKCMDIIYMLRPMWSRCFFQGSPATGIGVDLIYNAIFTDNIMLNCGRLWPGANVGEAGGGNPGGGSCLDWNTSTTGGPTLYDSHVIANNMFIFPGRSAVRNSGGASSNPLTPYDFNRVISNNVVISNKNNNCGIEDDLGIGVIITGNHVHCVTSQPSQGFGIASTSGIYGLIENNYVQGWYTGIALYDDAVNHGAATSGYAVRGNTVKDSTLHGVSVRVDSPYTLDSLDVTDNKILNSGAAGIAFINAGTGGAIKNLVINGNTIANNGLTTAVDAFKTGVYFGVNVTNLTMNDNTMYDDNTGTQKYGVTVEAAISVLQAFVNDNNLKNVATQAINILATGALSGWVSNNPGYNPQGAVALSPGGSPWTYTAGNTPEVVYLAGGTVSNVTKNAISIATALNASTPLPIALDPGESFVVTYTVAPTIAVADRK